MSDKDFIMDMKYYNNLSMTDDTFTDSQLYIENLKGGNES